MEIEKIAAFKLFGSILGLWGVVLIFRAVYCISDGIDIHSKEKSGFKCDQFQGIFILLAGLYYFSVGFLIMLNMVSFSYAIYNTLPLVVLERVSAIWIRRRYLKRGKDLVQKFREED